MKALSTFLTRSNAMLQRLTIIDHIPEEEEFLKMLDTRPGYHGCGSIKGKKEKFPKRKEKKRKGGIS